MRTTNTMMTNTFLRNLYSNNKTLNKYSNQLSSTKRILRASDDPIGTVRSIQVRKSIASKEDFQSTTKEGTEMMVQTESCLSEVNDIIQRLEELVGIGESDLYTSDQKQSTAYEIKQLRDELVSIGNTTFNGKYIFGGYNTTKEPFSVDDSGTLLYNGLDLTAGGAEIDAEATQKMSYQVDTSTSFDISVNGVDFLGSGEDNLYNVLTNIVNIMSDENSTAADMDGYKEKIGNALSNNLALMTDLGGRQARLELITSRYDDDLLNLEDKRSNVEDIDQAETITKYKFAYSAYEAALSVGAQIIQPSLLDYIS